MAARGIAEIKTDIQALIKTLEDILKNGSGEAHALAGNCGYLLGEYSVLNGHKRDAIPFLTATWVLLQQAAQPNPNNKNWDVTYKAAIMNLMHFLDFLK